METDCLLRVQLPPAPGWARNTLRTDFLQYPGTFLPVPGQNQKAFKKKIKNSIGCGRRGERWIFLKHKSYLSFESLGSVTSSDWFIYPSPNSCVYCRALQFPSSGPLG